MIDERRKKIVESRLKRAMIYREPYEKRWKVFTDYYHLKHDRKYNFIPLLSNYADSIRARWIASIFAGREFFGLVGRESQYEKNAETMQTLIIYQAEQEMNLISTIKDAFIPLSYLGNQVFMIVWNSQKKCPLVKLISLWDISFDPEADSVLNARWIIVKEEISYGRLLELQKEGLLQDVEMLKADSDVALQPNQDKSGYAVL
ncbi:MAG: hypothetical protein QME51_08650, partial [Planctomycetota bacterium]|nr:hypothetical protein [Planctomycetota bacterium]